MFVASLTYLGVADYLWIDPQSGGVIAYLNKGNNIFQELNGGSPIALGLGPGSGVYFADFVSQSLNLERRFQSDNACFRMAIREMITSVSAVNR